LNALLPGPAIAVGYNQTSRTGVATVR